MKFIALLIVVWVGIWFFRHRQTQANQNIPPATPVEPQDMLRCTQCGIHLPAIEAIKGLEGSYCSQEHLHQAEP